MRKALLLAFAFAFLLSGWAWAQNRTISGTVTDSGDGSPLPGVNVLVKGTAAGTVTDIDGKYALQVGEGAILVFSYVGYVAQEVAVGAQATVDVALAPDAKALEEVVVTALGVSREKASLGYAVQEVKGEQMAMVAENNVVQSLTGKVAGVQVIGASGANPGASTKIRLRGVTNLDDNASPLFVVDGTPISNESFGPAGRTHYSGARDYGNLASDINPNDIESITVLKGPSAAALYGQRGANGVIMITTKKGNKRKGIGVDFNHSTTFDRVYVLPEYQNEYGGGYTQSFSTFNFNPENHPSAWSVLDGKPMVNYNADESWGPRLEGQEVIHWDAWFPGSDDYLQTRPWSANPDNVRNFFNTGVSMNNNVSLSGGNDQASVRFSLGHSKQNGVLPNSALERISASLNASAKLSEKLSLSTSMMYVNTEGQGRPALGYGAGPVSSLNQWFQRQIDIDRLREYELNGSPTFWNIASSSISRGAPAPAYWNNPFWELYKNSSADTRDRVLGNIALSYQLTKDLKVSGIVRRDQYAQQIEEWVSTGGLTLDSYAHKLYRGSETNYEFLAEYAKDFGDFSLSASLGGNVRKNYTSRAEQETNGGLSVANFFDISASVARPNVETFRSQKEVRSVYAAASLGYKGFAYLDFTARRDWSSSLPAGSNAYTYPSVSASFVFSEVVKIPAVSFGKVRLSWASIGSDVDPYNIFTTYTVGTTPYGSNPVLFVNDVLQNQNLKPQLSSNIEAGLNVAFLEGRIGFDVAVYQNTVQDQILRVAVSGASGYGEAWVNAGEIEAKGIEFMLNASPVRKGDFSWDIDFNIARNRTYVNSLYEDLTNKELQLALSDGWGGLRVNARVGEEWGTLTGGGFQTFQATDAQGNPIEHPSNGKRIVDADGFYQYQANKELGSILPDFTGGLRNTFTYKNLSLSVFMDFQKGGQFFSITRMFNAYSGLGAETVGNNDKGNPIRDDIAEGGGIRVDGVDENGEAVTAYVEAQSYYANLFGMNENWLYDASYIKLRELRLGYSLPNTVVSKTPFRNISVAVIAKNLLLIHSNVDGIDPSEIAEGIGGYNAVEGGVLPGVRSLGFNIKFGF